MVNSATASVDAAGVWTTVMPAAAAAFVSMFYTPTPARAMTFNAGADSMTSADTSA